MSKKNETTNYQGLYGCGDLTQYRSRAPQDPYAQAAYGMAPQGRSNRNNPQRNPGYAPYNPYPPQPYDPYQGGYYPQDPYAGQPAPYDYGYGADNNYPNATPFKQKKPVRKFIAFLSLIFSALIIACIVLDYMKMIPYAFITASGVKIGAVDSVFALTKLFGLSFASNYYNAVQTLLAGGIVAKIEVLLFPAGVLLCALFSVILFLQSLFGVFGKKSGFVFCAFMCLISSGAMIASLILAGAKVGLATGYLTYGVAGASAFLLILSFAVNRKN